MKKALLVLLLVLALAVPAYAVPPAAFEQAVSVANQEILEKWGLPNFFTTFLSGKQVNRSVWEKPLAVGGATSRVLVFGEPHGDVKSGQPRYLGYTKTDEDFSNIMFPIEVWGREYIEDYDWISFPWNNSQVQATWGKVELSRFDCDPANPATWNYDYQVKLQRSIINGLKLETYRGKPIAGPRVEEIAWWQVVHVYQPPTEYTWGMGRMWNVGRDGKIYYKTVCLAPYSFAVKNLKVTNLTFSKNPAQEGDNVVVSAVVVNECDENVTTTVRYAFNNKNFGEPEITIPAKGQVPVSFTITAPSPGKYPAVIFVNPYKNRPSEESNILTGNWPGDNWAEGTLVVKEQSQQEGPGSLTFKAVSQNRQIPRPVNTAKWTDWVTAELRPPAPVPPRGSLDWWEITSAELTYPLKNHEFTFGTPYPPVGTKTIDMKPDGHIATVEFQEDWGMDGAKIYSILEKKMMAEYPKNYTLTARYTIRYQYSWTECDEDGCWTETRIATTSGTTAGDLLVNGTGVNSRAQ